VGMGLDLYRNSPTARQVFEQADQVLDMPLSKLCFEGPEEELRQTINAQPAIMMASVACLKAAQEHNHPPTPAFTAGHSLGEYTALVAAGALSFTEALRLVRERGRLMQEAGQATPGGMAAIIGLDRASVEKVCLESGAHIANLNSREQIAISGSKEAIEKAMALAKAMGAKRAIPLQVSGAFHCCLMQSAVAGMAEAISKTAFSPPKVPVVANSTVEPLTTADAVKEELLRQLCNCVNWHPTVEYMIQNGVSTFVEIGPGRVLTGLIKRIDENAQVFNISDMTSVKSVDL
ncbi:MAG: ACP S-malonyltransferase, partial [Chloroflexi bacterium]|nr:ACP S-malonyltransferase [Chloroflexota bacterium]